MMFVVQCMNVCVVWLVLCVACVEACACGVVCVLCVIVLMVGVVLGIFLGRPRLLPDGPTCGSALWVWPASKSSFSCQRKP